MDHTYSFYIALSQLMLNEYENAAGNFKKTIEEQVKQLGEAHHLDLYYYAVTHYELGQYEKALAILEQTLSQYPQFSEALCYKALCMMRLGKPQEEYVAVYEQGKDYAAQGYTINEDNAIYEPYPYRVRWD